MLSKTLQQKKIAKTMLNGDQLKTDTQKSFWLETNNFNGF